MNLLDTETLGLNDRFLEKRKESTDALLDKKDLHVFKLLENITFHIAM